MSDGLFWICNLTMGICVAGIALVSRGNYAAAIDYVERDLRDRLRSLRISAARLRSWINIWIAIVGATFLTIWLGLGMPVIGLLTAVLMGAGPWYVVRNLAQARRERIEQQLADAMVTFSSAVRAGLSLAQALEMLSIESPGPINQEFAQIIGEYNLGKPLERTLNEAKDRLRSENFALFAAALLASRESGGRINETVERISKSVLELQRLERKVMSETAQARKSAVYMAIVPAVILVMYSFIDPENVSLLFSTLPGQVMLSAALLLNILAYLWAVKILNADI